VDALGCAMAKVLKSKLIIRQGMSITVIKPTEREINTAQSYFIK
jgi:hypothetical protein